MAIQLRRTSEVHEAGVKAVVYGPAKVGKTALVGTLLDYSPLVISSEAGLLTLSSIDVPYIEVRGMTELREAYDWAANSAEAKQYGVISWDSVSETAESILIEKKNTKKDPRQAYGEMADEILDMVRKFRDIPEKHVFIISQMEKVADEQGRIQYGPIIPGSKAAQKLPYFFDLVLAMRVIADPDTKENRRMLMCDSDGMWQAGARGFSLSQWEEADLGAVIKKVRGQV